MGQNQQLLAILYLEFAKDAGEMVTDCDIANGKAIGYLFIFHPSPNKAYDFPFT
jgi:hypothetical protein